MKYLLVIAFVLVVFWLWRHNRQTEKNAAPPRARTNATEEKGITEMVACEVCHVHLPRSEALIGREGFYCSEAHRREAEVK